MSNAPSKEDILDEFAMEPHHDRGTLERYLIQYPAYATELLDLARELQRHFDDGAPLTAQDLELIERSWLSYSAIPVGDALASLSVEQLRKAADTLDLPRQVITAFREGRVRLSTVPARFLARLAELLGVAVLSFTTGAAAARSYKSDVKPDKTEDVPFEQILIDAGVTEERRRELTTDGDEHG